jgi:hypothetical protein
MCSIYIKLYYLIPYIHHQARFEVFTAVTMKNYVFWDVTPCDSCKNRRFGGTYGLNPQGEKNRRARNNVCNNQKSKHAAKKYYVRKEALEWDTRVQCASVASYC